MFTIGQKMFKNVYSRGVGGQNSAKFGLRSFWTTPLNNNEAKKSIRYCPMKYARKYSKCLLKGSRWSKEG